MKRATKRELIVVATMISRMIRTSGFSDRTEFSVITTCEGTLGNAGELRYVGLASEGKS